MNFISSVVNSIPGVGHVKGIVHYAVGDAEGGHEAMYQASRTTGVVAGSVIGGITGGPIGAVGGAMAGGAAVDSVVSVGSRKTVGVIGNLAETVQDIADGQNPVGSIAKTAMTLTVDGVGGALTGGVGSTLFVGQVGNAVAESAMTAALQEGVKSTAKGVAKTSVETVVKTVVKTTAEVVGKEILREAATEIVVVGATEGYKQVLEGVLNEVKKDAKGRQDKPKKKAENDNSSQAASTGTASGNKEGTGEKPTGNVGSATGGAGGQPPKKNKKPSFSEKKNVVFNLLKQIFDSAATELVDIRVGGQCIFRDLNRSQLEYLTSQIYPLTSEGTAVAVLEILREFISSLQESQALPTSEISFANFLSFFSAAKTIVYERLTDLVYSTYRDVPSFAERQMRALGHIHSGTVIRGLADDLVNLFTDEQVRNEITREQQRTNPSFRDFYAALSHWLKHRGDFTDHNGKFLTIEEYFRNGREMIEILRKKYMHLLSDLRGGQKIVFARVFARLDLRRLTIVLKMLEELVLSSIYIEDVQVEDDKDGDEILQDPKNPGKKGGQQQ